jgi:hypothetical protein
MKKFLPFVFPAIALAVILFLGFRWYNARTERTGQVSDFGEGVEIEDLSGTEQNKILKGVGDFKKVELKGEGENMGEIRYEIKDGKVRFSVMATLPELTEGEYQVWLKKVGGEETRKAFVLESGKSGYVGSAAIDETLLPLDVIVSKELRPDTTVEEILLTGTLQK